MFDCVMPTRNARNGSYFTANGTINIKIKVKLISLQLTKWQSLMWIQNTRKRMPIFAANEYLGKQIANDTITWFYMWLVRSQKTYLSGRDFRPWKTGW
jgi:queuine tRNA-ribosyltransferase